MLARSNRLVAALDIGTTKICVLVGHIGPQGNVEILGIGRAPCDGLKKGVVVNIAKTVSAIKTAVHEAQLMAGVPIEQVYIGISGGHISALNSRGVTPIKRGVVRDSDVQAAMQAAQAVPVPHGQQILHTIPQWYVVDGQERVLDPCGMHGIRLEVEAHIILGSVSCVQNLIRCCEMAGVQAIDIVLEQLASADAVLSPDERELGIALIDIGGGTCDVALYQHGSLIHTMVLPIAGDHITQDIALGLRTTFSDAERFKHEYASAVAQMIDPHERCIVVGADGTHNMDVQVQYGSAVVQARIAEMLSFISEGLAARQLHTRIPAGIVLTGGGSLVKNINVLAQSIFQAPVRTGLVRLSEGSPSLLTSPIYATVYGLLIHALRKYDTAVHDQNNPLMSRVLSRMKAWVTDFL